MGFAKDLLVARLRKRRYTISALFLSPAINAHGDGRLNPRVINTVFNEVCSLAGVEGHTPHDARHDMGRHLIEKNGNIATVQRQRGLFHPVRQGHRPRAG